MSTGSTIAGSTPSSAWPRRPSSRPPTTEGLRQPPWPLPNKPSLYKTRGCSRFGIRSDKEARGRRETPNRPHGSRERRRRSARAGRERTRTMRHLLLITPLRRVGILKPERVKSGPVRLQNASDSVKDIVLQDVEIEIHQRRVFVGSLQALRVERHGKPVEGVGEQVTKNCRRLI